MASIKRHWVPSARDSAGHSRWALRLLFWQALPIPLPRVQAPVSSKPQHCHCP